MNYLEIEEWRDIEGYEGLYQVSNLGAVRSLDTRVTCPASTRNKEYERNRKGRTLRQSIQRYGYLMSHICKDGKLRSFSTHRLVAIAFVPNPDNKPEVNHINGIKIDNRAENLEWCTSSENHKHAFELGMCKQHGEFNANSKLTEGQVRKIRKSYTYYSYAELSRIYGVNYNTIKNIITRKSWKLI